MPEDAVVGSISNANPEDIEASQRFNLALRQMKQQLTSSYVAWALSLLDKTHEVEDACDDLEFVLERAGTYVEEKFK